MAGVPAVASWRDMELGAPELARLGMARLTSARVALLGTLRRDGSPRISPIEPCIAQGQLLIGAMAWTAKASRPAARSAVCAAQRGDRPRQRGGRTQAVRASGRAGQDLRAAASGRVVADLGTGKGGRVHPAHQAGSVRRLGYQAWPDDGPPVVPAKRLRRGQPPLPIADGRHSLCQTSGPASAPQPHPPEETGQTLAVAALATAGHTGRHQSPRSHRGGLDRYLELLQRLRLT